MLTLKFPMTKTPIQYKQRACPASYPYEEWEEIPVDIEEATHALVAGHTVCQGWNLAYPNPRGTGFTVTEFRFSDSVRHTFPTVAKAIQALMALSGATRTEEECEQLGHRDGEAERNN